MNIASEELFIRRRLENGACVEIVGKPAAEIWDGIVQRLDAEGRALVGTFDYITPAVAHDYDPQGQRVIVYSVRGGSEGWYLHVGQLRNGMFTGLILGKTLDARPDRLKRLERKIWDILDEGE